MIKNSVTALSAASLYFGATVMASAQSVDAWFTTDNTDIRQTTSVPEIDASTGMLALAAVMASLVLAWELKRRRAS